MTNPPTGDTTPQPSSEFKAKEIMVSDQDQLEIARQEAISALKTARDAIEGNAFDDSEIYQLYGNLLEAQANGRAVALAELRLKGSIANQENIKVEITTLERQRNMLSRLENDSLLDSDFPGQLVGDAGRERDEHQGAVKGRIYTPQKGVEIMIRPLNPNTVDEADVPVHRTAQEAWHRVADYLFIKVQGGGENALRLQRN